MIKNYENNMALFERQADLCYALSHPIRLYILDLLSQEEMSSTQLLDVLDIPKANLSQHLSVLKEAGILKARKEGTYQMLSLALPKIKDACQLVRGILADRLNEEQKQMKKLARNLDIQKSKFQKSTNKKKEIL